jgi:two-component system response regulator DesR
MIRIGIAEDQALIRESLAIVLGLEPDMEVVWTAATGVNAVSQVDGHPVDIVLMDLRMPDMDGVTAIRRIVKLHVRPRILVLTTFHHEEWLMEAIDAGAAACLLKEIPPPLLVTAIRQIVHGEWEPAAWTADWRSYAPQIQFRMRLSASRTDQDLDALTLREMEIVRRICSGDSNKEIAVGLHLSEGTVKNYVSAIYLKLGARHRAEAVRIARERLGY